jgi:hypothetical protein
LNDACAGTLILRILRELSANSAQVPLMPLSLSERLTMLMPPS